jgi:hypothetical protein
MRTNFNIFADGFERARAAGLPAGWQMRARAPHGLTVEQLEQPAGARLGEGGQAGVRRRGWVGGRLAGGRQQGERPAGRRLVRSAGAGEVGHVGKKMGERKIKKADTWGF